MPVVHGKHYAYTKKGKAAAKKARKKKHESVASIVANKLREQGTRFIRDPLNTEKGFAGDRKIATTSVGAESLRKAQASSPAQRRAADTAATRAATAATRAAEKSRRPSPSTTSPIR